MESSDPAYIMRHARSASAGANEDYDTNESCPGHLATAHMAAGTDVPDLLGLLGVAGLHAHVLAPLSVPVRT